MKYIIAQLLGKQILLKCGEWYDINFVKKGLIGDFLFLNKILLFYHIDKIQVGKPFLLSSKISAQILQQVKGPKITILKTKPKKNYTRTKGHRQWYTRIKLCF